MRDPKIDRDQTDDQFDEQRNARLAGWYDEPINDSNRHDVGAEW